MKHKQVNDPKTDLGSFTLFFLLEGFVEVGLGRRGLLFVLVVVGLSDSSWHPLCIVLFRRSSSHPRLYSRWCAPFGGVCHIFFMCEPDGRVVPVFAQFSDN
jgi:hypothetical protein